MRNEGARDWFVLIDGTHVGAVSAVIAERFTGPAAAPFPLPVSVGTYSLMWDLAKSDIAQQLKQSIRNATYCTAALVARGVNAVRAQLP